MTKIKHFFQQLKQSRRKLSEVQYRADNEIFKWQHFIYKRRHRKKIIQSIKLLLPGSFREDLVLPEVVPDTFQLVVVAPSVIVDTSLANGNTPPLNYSESATQKPQRHGQH